MVKMATKPTKWVGASTCVEDVILPADGRNLKHVPHFVPRLSQNRTVVLLGSRPVVHRNLKCHVTKITSTDQHGLT